MSGEWKRCSSCKKGLAFGQTYYACSVSTCNRKRTGLFFCSVECWEVHLPMARHREAWAVEETAPTREAWLASEGAKSTGPNKSTAPPAANSAPQRRSAPPGPTVRRRVVADGGSSSDVPKEVLVVVSRFKAYVKARHNMNTSDGVFDLISEELRRLADKASDYARMDGRKTLLERDFGFLSTRER